MVILDNACYLSFHIVTTITLFRERQYLCDYVAMGLNKWLSSVIPSALLLSQGPGGEPPEAGPSPPVPESSTPTEAAKFTDPIAALLGFLLFLEIYWASCVRPDRGIALGGSGLGFNCHFVATWRWGFSSKLWPDLGKPVGAHHQAQSCHKTLRAARALLQIPGLGQWRGFIKRPWCTCHSSPATICHTLCHNTEGTVSSSELPSGLSITRGTLKMWMRLNTSGERHLGLWRSLCHFHGPGDSVWLPREGSAGSPKDRHVMEILSVGMVTQVREKECI